MCDLGSILNNISTAFQHFLWKRLASEEKDTTIFDSRIPARLPFRYTSFLEDLWTGALYSYPWYWLSAWVSLPAHKWRPFSSIFLLRITSEPNAHDYAERITTSSPTITLCNNRPVLSPLFCLVHGGIRPREEFVNSKASVDLDKADAQNPPLCSPEPKAPCSSHGRRAFDVRT